MPRSVAASASSFEDGDSGNPFLSADNPDSADLADQCDRARDSLACQGEQPPDLEASATCASAAIERSRSEPREFGPRNKELPLSKEAVQRTARIHWFRQQVLNRSVMPIWSSTSVTTAHGTEAWPNCSACLGVSRMAMTQRASLSLFAQDCLNRKSATCAQTLPQCLSYWGSQSRRMTRYGSAPQGGSTTRASSLSSKGCSSFWLRNLQDDLSCATHEPTSRSCWSIVHWVSIRTSYLHVGPCWSKRDRKPSRTGSTVEVMDRCPLPALPRLLAQGTDVMMQPLVGKSLFFRTCSIAAPFSSALPVTAGRLGPKSEDAGDVAALLSMHLQAPYATSTNHCTCIDMRVGESIGRGSPGTVLSSSLSSSSLRASCQTAGTLHVQFVFLRLCLLVGSQKPPRAPRHAQVLLGHPRLSCHAIGCQICLVWSGLLVFLLLATLRGSFFSVCRRYRLHWATFRLCKGAYRRKRVSALPRERLRLPAPVTDSLHAPSKVQRADTPPLGLV